MEAYKFGTVVDAPTNRELQSMSFFFTSVSQFICIRERFLAVCEIHIPMKMICSDFISNVVIYSKFRNFNIMENIQIV